MTPSLTTIAAFARAGASRHAWRLFQAAGLAAISDDPDVLTLHGRLLKDQARAATGDTRRRLARAAGAAYAAAAVLRPATFPLINAATLALIGGDPATAAARAGEVLALLDAPAEPDTPYWLAATRAEALLLLGDAPAAETVLKAAIALAPRAWEDHAITLRQFAVIIAEQAGDAHWLDPLRPPRSLHYTGAMSLTDDGLAARIDAALADFRIGFGFGALAAGADLLIAERLLAAGAELHVLLPGGRAAFVAHSVAPWDAQARFEATLAGAASVTEIGDPAAFTAALDLADDTAMGLAIMSAESLQSEAVQLVIADAAEPAGGHHSARSADVWATTRRPQIRLLGAIAPVPSPTRRPAARLVALVAVALAPPAASLADALAAAARLSLLPPSITAATARCWTPDGVIFVFDTPGQAATAAFALRDALAPSGPVRVAVHYGAVALIDAGTCFGPAPAIAAQILGATPDTAIVASEAFAAAWRTTGPGPFTSEFIGELEGLSAADPIRLHALEPPAYAAG